MLVVGILVLAALLCSPALLTMVGAHARGLSVPGAFLAGLFFPVAWAHWYVADEHPYAGRLH